MMSVVFNTGGIQVKDGNTYKPLNALILSDERQKAIFDLLSEYIDNTEQSINYSSGVLSSITHKRNNITIRTDSFSFLTNQIIEVRVLYTGQSMTITTNTATLKTTIIYSES